jgi:hypothetical protein
MGKRKFIDSFKPKAQRRRLLRRHARVLIFDKSSLGGVFVSMLAIGPKARGFKPGRGDGFLRAINSATRLSLEGK